MRSPVKAVAWEICARNWWHLVLAIGPLAWCALVVQQVVPAGSPEGRESVTMNQVFSCIATFMALVWITSFTESDSRGRFGGFPSWMYTLPVRTVKLVTLPIGVAMALMAAAVVLWECNICFYWGMPIDGCRLAWHVLIGLATLVATQAAIWSLYHFRWTRIVVLVLVIYGGIFAALYSQIVKFPGGYIPWMSGAAFAMLCAVAAAVAGVELDRRGEWKPWTTILLQKLLDLVPRRSAPFKSAAHAQFWIDWRRRGIFCSSAFGVVLALALLIVPLPTALVLGSTGTFGTFCALLLSMIALLATIGTSLGKSDPWSADLTIHPLIATRPVTTAHLVFSKMKVAAAIVLLGWVLFGLLSIPAISWCNHANWPIEQAQRFWPDLAKNYPAFWGWIRNPAVIAAFFAASWHVVVAAMAITLTGSKKMVLISFWKGAILWSLVASAIMWVTRFPARLESIYLWLPFVTTLLFALSVGSTLWAFLRVRHFLKRGDLLVLLLMWSVVALLVVVAALFATAAHSVRPAVIWFMTAFLFFPSGEIPSAVMALQHNRHR